MAIENLEDFSMDVPRAPQYLVGMLKKLISERVLSAEQVSDLVKRTDLIKPSDILGQVCSGSSKRLGGTILHINIACLFVHKSGDITI